MSTSDGEHKRPKPNIVTITQGEQYTFDLMDTGMDASGRLEWSTSEPDRVTARKGGIITAKAPGEATITATDRDTKEQYKWKVHVIESSRSYSAQALSMLPIKLSDDERDILYQEGITDIVTLQNTFSTQQELEDGASRMNVDEEALKTWCKEALLFLVPGMTADVAYWCVKAGIRNPADLAQMNVDKLYDILSVIKTLPDIGDPGNIPDKGEFYRAAAEAGRLLPSQIPGFHRVFEGDETPLPVLWENPVNISDAKILSEGLSILSETDLTLPLPKTISGTVLQKVPDADGSGYTHKALSGYKVEISGIADPSQDRVENAAAMCCYTDHEGRFSMVMPDRYNLKETVTFTVTEKVTKAFTQVVIGTSSPKQITFVRRASEIVDHAFIVITTTEGTGEEAKQVTTRYTAAEVLKIFRELDEKSRENLRLESILLKEAQDAAKIKKTKKAFDFAVQKRRDSLQALLEEMQSILEGRQQMTLEAEEAAVRAEQELISAAKNVQLKRYFRLKCDEAMVCTSLQDFSGGSEEPDNPDTIGLSQRRIELRERLLQIEQNNLFFAEELREFVAEQPDIENLVDLEPDGSYTCNLKVPSGDEILIEFSGKLEPPEEARLSGEYLRFHFDLEGGNALPQEEEYEKCKGEYEERRGEANAIQLENEQIQRAMNQVSNRIAMVGTEPVTFLTPNHSEITPSAPIHEQDLQNLLSSEDDALLGEAGFGVLEGEETIIALRRMAREAKGAIYKAAEELHMLTSSLRKEEEIDLFLYLQQLSDDGKIQGYEKKHDPEISNAQRYVDNMNACGRLLEKLGRTKWDIRDALTDFLNTGLDADIGILTVQEDAFVETAAYPNALPSVRLMGEGTNAVYLPTDTAPSRIFNFSMVRRLIEPSISQNNRPKKRDKLDQALDVASFQQNLQENFKDIPLATSLGIGYMLNMHQAWIPDGFALGTLLYSMVLAPGEEQRIIVKEHSERYNIDDMATADGSVRDSYSNLQQDNESAAFSNAVNRYSGSHSDYGYQSTASSNGDTRISAFFGIGARSKSTSSNTGSGYANVSQTDAYDEVSDTAQNFQTYIKTESERIASEKRTSIRSASSSEKASVASKIVANHNHSHVMTVQYWEVMRRYRLESCIEGIDLILFIPLQPIAFLPESKDPVEKGWASYVLSPDILNKLTADKFMFRYKTLLRYADVLQGHLPYRYRTGLNLICKFGSCTDWTYVKKEENKRTTVMVTLAGHFLEFDKLTARMTFNRGTTPLPGKLISFEGVRIHPSMNTRKDVLYFVKRAREGVYVIKGQTALEKSEDYLFFTVSSKDATSTHYYEISSNSAVNLTPQQQKLFSTEGKAVFSFVIPEYMSVEDIHQVIFENKVSDFTYHLNQNPAFMEKYEAEAIKNYEHILMDYAKDDKKNDVDERRMAHYALSLPECYTAPVCTFARSELLGQGGTLVDLKVTKQTTDSLPAASQGDTATVLSAVLSSPTLQYGAIYADLSDHKPKMFAEDVQKMEETLHHVTSNPMEYSQRVWASLSDDERILLLEPYTVDMDYTSEDNKTFAPEGAVTEPLLNCVNPKKLIGFYGNCMMLPFVYPEKLARKLGKTAGQVQDDLYRYHTNSFRVPSTVISVATEGMVGEAVLGATNVSEKIDITRFWNWKDSDSEIDHVSIDQNSLNSGSLLANASTLTAATPTQGAVPTAYINRNNLAAALVARQQPAFADALANTDIRQLLQSADTNASTGRDLVVQSTSELAKSALDAAVSVGTAAATGGVSGIAGGAAGGSITGLLGALGNAGLGDADLGKLAKGALSDAGGLSGMADSLVGMIGGDSNGLKSVLSSFDGEKLKTFLSDFAGNALSGSGGSLEENFKKSIENQIGGVDNVTTKDILSMAKSFCSDNGIDINDFAKKLGMALNLI